MKDVFKINMDASAKVEYRRIRKILELDPKIFQPCIVKEFERGILRKHRFFVHYDGKRWDILKISSDKIERYILE